MIKTTWKEETVKVCEECDEDIEGAFCDKCDESLLPEGTDDFFCEEGFHMCLDCVEKRNNASVADEE